MTDCITLRTATSRVEVFPAPLAGRGRAGFDGRGWGPSGGRGRGFPHTPPHQQHPGDKRPADAAADGAQGAAPKRARVEDGGDVAQGSLAMLQDYSDGSGDEGGVAEDAADDEQAGGGTHGHALEQAAGDAASA